MISSAPLYCGVNEYGRPLNELIFEPSGAMRVQRRLRLRDLNVDASGNFQSSARLEPCVPRISDMILNGLDDDSFCVVFITAISPTSSIAI